MKYKNKNYIIFLLYIEKNVKKELDKIYNCYTELVEDSK